MKHSEQLGDLAAALAKAQAAMKPAKKSGRNPHFNSAFATLEDVWDSAREPLTTNGLSVVQLPGVDEGKPGLGTMVIHTSGQWVWDFFPFPSNVKQDPQGFGAACSYFRRYATSAAVGVVTEDDDAERAMQRNDTAETRQPPAPKAAPKTPPPKAAPPNAPPALKPPPKKPIDASQADNKDKRSTLPQQKMIWALWGDLGYSEALMRKRLKEHFSKDSTKDLTTAEASSVIDELQKQIKARDAAATAGQKAENRDDSIQK